MRNEAILNLYTQNEILKKYILFSSSLAVWRDETALLWYNNQNINISNNTFICCLFCFRTDQQLDATAYDGKI